jgi:hypothetical protein
LGHEETERNAAIWRAYVSGRTQVSLAEEYGVDQSRISQICATFRDAIKQETKEERALRELAFLDEVRERAMEVAKLPAPPVTAGKDGDIVYDPTNKGPDGKPAVVRDHGGRLTAMSLAVQTSAHMRKLLGLDAPTRTEITGGVRHEVVGVDPEALT